MTLATCECGTQFLQAMIRVIFLALAVLGIAQRPWLVADHMDVDVHEHMQQCAELLRQDMSQLLHEVEERSQEQSGVAPGALFFTALQQWQLWAFAGLLVLLFGLCWWLRKRSRELGSSSKQGSSTSKGKQKEEEEEVKECSDCDDTCHVGRVWADRLQ